MFMDLDNMLSAWKNVNNGLRWKLYLGLLLNVTFIVSLDGATRELIIGRGRYKVRDTAQQYADNFTYTDNSICLINNQEKASNWCKTKNADPSTTAKHGQCSCQCQYNFITFFVAKEMQRCVNDSYLKNHQHFGDGEYLLSPPIDLDGGGTMDTTKSCDGCKIKSIMYYFDNKWNNISKCGWKIEKNGSLKWPPVNTNQPKGKILKIQLKNCKLKSNESTCSWGSRTPKIFTKSKGNYSINLDASVSTPSSSTLLPTPSLTRISAIMTSSLQDTSMTSQISLRVVSTTSVFMGSQYVCRDSINCQSSTSAVIQYSTTSKPGNDSALAEDPSSVGAIVGSIVACIVLMAVIVFCFVWKRCKVNSRESSSGATKGPPDSSDNPMYGKNQGEVIALPRRQGKDGLGAGVEEYDYAAVHGDGSKYHSVQSKPIYQSLIKDNVQDSVYTSLNKKTPLPEYSYNHLQHPTYNPPHSKDVPSKLLYNKLQKPNDDYLEPGLTINENENGTSEEPVYNVLEDPNANPDLQDSEPVYNVLEDPNSNLVPSQEPLYNVLEDPDDNYDNAPVDDQNHAASGQDNIAYSSNIDLVIPLSPSSPDYDVLEGPEGTLSDPTYQPLSIRTQDDVYQPLDRASQPVYQTLDPNESKV